MSTAPMGAYDVVHYLLRKCQGSAAEHRCVRCGEQAQEWAYQHDDVFERIDAGNGLTYSLDFDHYRPMCRPCHRRFDMDHRGSADEVPC